MHEFATSETAGATVEPTADAAVAGRTTETERIYGDQHHHAHAAPFEHHHAHADRTHPKQDRFNRPGVHDDPTTVHSAGRPGVVAHGNGVFMINKPEVTRYTFTRHGDANVAQPFDLIERDRLASINYKAEHKTSDHGRTERVLVNPSAPRTLEIEGKSAHCVLTWVDGRGAAWMRTADLEHGDQIAHAAASRAHHEDPAAASQHELLHHTERYVIRNDAVGQATPGDSPHGRARVLGAGQRSGDNVEHYLDKDERKPGFDANGQPTGQNVTVSFVAICMNLPEHGTPPVAIDTVRSGESFYVLRDPSFHRQVPVYENGAHHSDLLQTWVFGHVGMRDAHGHLAPDPHRRGWVPLRVLAQANHLTIRDVPART